MIDRMACADGGNPDPSSTHGKTAKEAKALELKGWPYPRHLAGRHFGLVAHGDSVGAETLRRSLADWLTDMKLISAGGAAESDGLRFLLRNFLAFLAGFRKADGNRLLAALDLAALAAAPALGGALLVATHFFLHVAARAP
jgi:hypothetical protein